MGVGICWGVDGSVWISGRGCDSGADENSPKVIIILFSLSSSLMYLDGEVLSVLPGLYFTFGCPFSAGKDLGSLCGALLSFPGMGHLKFSFS